MRKRKNFLSQREAEVLENLCLETLKELKPVGSKRISERIRGRYSPATIRNIFISLERKGYLKKKHISSGRMPTDLGWRYFVDNRKDLENKTEPIELTNSDFREIIEKLSHSSRSLILFFSFWRENFDFFYQSGISYLFMNRLLEGSLEEIAEDIDRLIKIFPFWILKEFKTENWPVVLIGQECQISKSGQLSFLINNLNFDKRQLYLLLIGSKVMAYQRNLFLLEKGIEALAEVLK